MISVFVIWIIVVITFRAVGTSHEDKSPIDRFGEIVSNKPIEKKEHKRGRARKVAIYASKYPMLDRVWKRCSMEEKEKINEAITIIYDKKMDILREEGKLETLEEREKK